MVFGFGKARDGTKPTKYLGGSGDALTVWISLAASTVLVFYGYDQVGSSPLLTWQDSF